MTVTQTAVFDIRAGSFAAAVERGFELGESLDRTDFFDEAESNIEYRFMKVDEHYKFEEEEGE